MAGDGLVLVGEGPAAGYVRVIVGQTDEIMLPDEARELALSFAESEPAFAEALSTAADEAARRVEEKRKGSFTSRVGRRKKSAKPNPDRRAILRRAMRGT